MRVEEPPDQMAGDELLHEKKQLDSPKQKRLEAIHITKLRKLTALLLTGALTLLLLTACSGGGGSSGPEAQTEAKVMRAIRSNPATASLTYDDETQRIAKDKLTNTNLDTELNGGIGKYKFYHKVDIDSSNSTLTLIAQYDYQNTKLEDLIDCIIEGNKSSNLNFNLSSKWTKVGVAATTHNGKTYIAITLQVKKT